MSDNTDIITATLIEKELFEVDISEKEIITVNFKSIDVIYKNVDSTVYTDIFDKFVKNETPVKLTATQFQTSVNYLPGSLEVFLNGQKIHNSEITESATNKFIMPISVLSSDKIEVNYKKSL